MSETPTQALARDVRGCLWAVGVLLVLGAIGCGAMSLLPLVFALEGK
jgi:hypothetical protein